jgi:hypothetical protein
MEENGYVDWPVAFKRKPGRPPKMSSGNRPAVPVPVVACPTFKCRVCGKVFFKISKLTAHMRIHR